MRGAKKAVSVVVLASGEKAPEFKIYDQIEVIQLKEPSLVVKKVRPDVSSKDRIDLLIRAKVDEYKAVGIDVSEPKLAELVREDMEEASS